LNPRPPNAKCRLPRSHRARRSAAKLSYHARNEKGPPIGEPLCVGAPRPATPAVYSPQFLARRVLVPVFPGCHWRNTNVRLGTRFALLAPRYWGLLFTCRSNTVRAIRIKGRRALPPPRHPGVSAFNAADRANRVGLRSCRCPTSFCQWRSPSKGMKSDVVCGVAVPLLLHSDVYIPAQPRRPSVYCHKALMPSFSRSSARLALISSIRTTIRE
jgi:hypothetical protein